MIVRFFESSHVHEHGEIMICPPFESSEHKKEQPRHWKKREKDQNRILKIERRTVHTTVKREDWNLKIERRTYNLGIGGTQK